MGEPEQNKDVMNPLHQAQHSPGILVDALAVLLTACAIGLVSPGLSVRSLGAVGTGDSSAIPESAKFNNFLTF